MSQPRFKEAFRWLRVSGVATLGAIITVLVFPTAWASFLNNLACIEMVRLAAGDFTPDQTLDSPLNRLLYPMCASAPSPCLSKAAVYLQIGLTMDPNAGNLYRNLSLVQLTQGEYDSAVRSAAIAVQLRPADDLAHLALGDAYESLGKRDEAIIQWSLAGAVFRLLDHAQTLASEARWDEAIRFYERALEIQPRNRMAMAGLARAVYEGQRDVPRAIGLLQEAIEIAPEFVWNYFTLAEIYLLEGNLSSAEQWYLRAKEVAPTNPGSYWGLATIYWEKERDSERAIAELRAAFRHNPTDAGLCIRIGTIYRDSGELDEALRWYETAAQIDSLGASPHWYIGHIYLLQGMTAQAIEHFEIAVSRDPSNTSYHFFLGRALAQAGDLNLAILSFGDATELDPDNVAYHTALADAYRDLGQKNQAIGEYQVVVRLDPSDDYARRQIEQLSTE